MPLPPLWTLYGFLLLFLRFTFVLALRHSQFRHTRLATDNFRDADPSMPTNSLSDSSLRVLHF
ncbi:hypothetical protein FB45DRAFT_1024800 [Roridomyces roridus]|uniref:Uncharacterized protein n=1 Tax=Roridomyces roridus TaxID=1738132 RepID=A0AAD7C1M8_9AGAR|nr:hypothetical protein FB45DRAFT_1024800 [Roridomyces roridus]